MFISSQFQRNLRNNLNLLVVVTYCWDDLQGCLPRIETWVCRTNPMEAASTGTESRPCLATNRVRIWRSSCPSIPTDDHSRHAVASCETFPRPLVISLHCLMQLLSETHFEHNVGNA